MFCIIKYTCYNSLEEIIMKKKSKEKKDNMYIADYSIYPDNFSIDFYTYCHYLFNYQIKWCR